MNKLFSFTQAKGKWHKFPSFNLEGGAKLYKNLAQKLLAVSLCAAMVLCTVPLRGGGHVSEAAEEEGTVLNIVLTGDDSSGDLSVSVDWSSFDLSVPPSLALSSSPALLADLVFYIYTDLSKQLAFAHRASAASPWSYSDLLFTAGPVAGSVAVACVPRCVGCWSSYSLYPEFSAHGRPLPVTTVPALPTSLLFRSSVALPSAVGSSASWSPGVDVAHCDACAVSLVAPDGAPVAVSGTYDDGWTITRSASGEAVLDLLVGDFKVGEVTVTEAAAGPSYLEATVDVKGQQQRLRVYDPNGVLPEGTTLSAEAVTAHEHLDDDHEIEHLLSYNISLLDAAGDALPMPLSNTVELCFEVLAFLDEDELDAVLVQQFNDREFIETRVERDGARWVLINTDHFSPYALIDKLSPEEKAALTPPDNNQSDETPSDETPKHNVQTGDHAAQIAVAGLGLVLVLALGIMLRLITNKRKFEE